MVFAKLLVAAVVVVGCAPCGVVASTLEGEFTEEPYLGKRPPELVSTGGQWWNSEGPLTLESLRGQPTVLVYSALW